MENVKKFLQLGEEFPGVLSVSVGQIGKPVNDELIVRRGCKFLLEQRPDSSPSFLCRRELEVTNRRRKPFFCLTSKAKSEICEHCSVIPVVGNLAFINP